MNKGTRIRTLASMLGRAATRKPLVVNLNANVTNLCTQSCPHCNAVAESRARTHRHMTLDDLRTAVNNLAPWTVPTISFSGGEPTVNPELPDMLEWAGRRCAFGINLNTNLYGPGERLRRALDAAMCVDARIDVSFDGFGDVADRLRGAKDVSERVSRMMRWVSRRRVELQSRSVLTCHTVLNDLNLPQVFRIIRFSDDLGWRQTLAPVNRFGYQEDIEDDAFSLQNSGMLRKVLAAAMEMPNRGQSDAFLRRIPSFLDGIAPKMCPYLKFPFRTYKLFLEPDGDVTLCDRNIPVGNLIETDLREILRGEQYQRAVASAGECRGCWMICYVEPMLRGMPWKAWKVPDRLTA